MRVLKPDGAVSGPQATAVWGAEGLGFRKGISEARLVGMMEAPVRRWEKLGIVGLSAEVVISIMSRCDRQDCRHWGRGRLSGRGRCIGLHRLLSGVYGLIRLQ